LPSRGDEDDELFRTAARFRVDVDREAKLLSGLIATHSANATRDEPSHPLIAGWSVASV
jgi:hypothetical protein